MDLETKKVEVLLHGIPTLIKDNIDTGIKQQLVHWH
jgi:Asp-tRNA(Asn)/Glu-tRNA(Gln) amidotransferase A subunit family amidase